MRRALIALAALGVVVLGAGVWVTGPNALPAGSLEELDGDPEAGERVFWAAGCASCHSAPGAEDDARLVLAGGQRFPSEFGTFLAPNISMDSQRGIGAWDAADFANAVQRGISPEGAHYYPAFPYTAYALARPQDIADLWAFWQTLPADATPSLPHELGFPFNIRRAIGVWKALYLPEDWAVAVEGTTLERGRYLSEALGHCAECHTPRDALGGLDRSRWLAGAPNPSGDGRIPNITPAALDWSVDEIAAYLADGFTPEFDSAGGHMVSVIRNLAYLSDDDRRAIAAYLTAVPPVE